MTDAALPDDNGFDRYPYNSSHLSRGDSIPYTDIERAMGVKFTEEGSNAWNLAVLRFREIVQDQMEDRLGGTVLTKSDATGRCLRVLTTPETAVQLGNIARNGLRKQHRSLQGMLNIDRMELDAEQQRELTESQRRLAIQLAAQRCAVRAARMNPAAIAERLRVEFNDDD